MLYDELVEGSVGTQGRPFDSLGYIAGSIVVGFGEKKFFNAMERWNTKSLTSKHLGEFIDFNKELGSKTKTILRAAGFGGVGPARRGNEYLKILGQQVGETKQRFYAARNYTNKLGVAKSAIAKSNKGLRAMSAGLSKAIGVTTFFELMALGVNLAIGAGAPGVSRAAMLREQTLGEDELMMDTRTAYTQRQRAIQAIHDSQLSVGRAIIGQEAQYLHR